MKNVEQKRRRGRPATGLTPIIALRLAAEEIQIVDDLAAELHVDRSKALRELLREGLKTYARKKKKEAAARRRAAAAQAAIVEEVLATDEPEDRPAPAPKQRSGYRRARTPEEVRAIADRAQQRSAKGSVP